MNPPWTNAAANATGPPDQMGHNPDAMMAQAAV